MGQGAITGDEPARLWIGRKSLDGKNPGRGCGTKQARGIGTGVNRREAEKACGRNVAKAPSFANCGRFQCYREEGRKPWQVVFDAERREREAREGTLKRRQTARENEPGVTAPGERSGAETSPELETGAGEALQ